MTWADIEIKKLRKTAAQVKWGRVTKDCLIYALAHRLAKAKREITKLKKGK